MVNEKLEEDIKKILYNGDEGDRDLFWKLYTNVYGECLGNAEKSARLAGWSKEKARRITRTSWFIQTNRRRRMEKNAEKFLETLSKTQELSDPNQIHLLRLKQDTAKFILERLNKKVYSSRSEVTGKGGKDFTPLLVKFIGDEKTEQDN